MVQTKKNIIMFVAHLIRSLEAESKGGLLYKENESVHEEHHWRDFW
jgi:hypothetical protein